MRSFGTVKPTFWNGDTGRALREAGAVTQLLALYLMTNPHANMLGLYYLPLVLVSKEVALSAPQIAKAIERCEGPSIAFAGYDHDVEYVWVYEMARHQLGDELKNGDHRIKATQRMYAEMPSNRFLGEFHDKYAAAFQLGPRRSPLGRPLKGAPWSPVQAVPDLVPVPSSLQRLFEKFWGAFPKKVGKDAAWREFEKLKPGDDLTDLMLASIQEQRASEQWLKDRGQFIPHPRTWLHQGRWKDSAKIDPPQAESAEAWVCLHLVHCSSRAECENATIIQRPEREKVTA